MHHRSANSGEHDEHDERDDDLSTNFEMMKRQPSPVGGAGQASAKTAVMA